MGEPTAQELEDKKQAELAEARALHDHARKGGDVNDFKDD